MLFNPRERDRGLLDQSVTKTNNIVFGRASSPVQIYNCLLKNKHFSDAIKISGACIIKKISVENTSYDEHIF